MTEPQPDVSPTPASTTPPVPAAALVRKIPPPPSAREMLRMLRSVTEETPDANVLLPDPWFDKVAPHYQALQRNIVGTRAQKRQAFKLWQRGVAPVIAALSRLALAS